MKIDLFMKRIISEYGQGNRKSLLVYWARRSGETMGYIMEKEFDPKNYKIAVLTGGRSGEREISLKSGASAAGALEEAGFAVEMIDPANKEELVKLIQGDFDVAFLTTHGRYGEDGILQGFLELLDIPYTGSGVLGSALAMNKPMAKMVYRAAGLPTAPSITLKKGDALDIDAIVAICTEHCVIKAASEGSTIGLYIAESVDEIEGDIKLAYEHDDVVLIEKFVKGREFTVPVIGNDNAHALPIIEIIPKNAFYDFESKYAPGGSQHICPAEIPADITAAMQKCAEEAHKALGCRGVSRTDFILEESGDFWILETNTLPGMTATSLLPDSARVDGMSFPELCTYFVQLALEK